MLFIFFVVLFSTASAQFGFLTNYRCYSIPPKPVNGRYEYVGTGITRYSTVRYVCDSGFTLQGSSYNSCQNQRWTLQVPLCIPSDPCRPRNPCRLYETCIPVYFPSVTHRCNCRSGYIRNKYGSCARSCSRPYPWSNADYTPNQSQYAEFDSITWTCDDGYTERYPGVRRQTCIYGRWGTGSPTCLRDGCRPPSIPLNGDFTPKRSFYAQGDHILYSCNDGFQLDDAASVRCGNTNTFGNIPQCIAACPSPVPPEGGAVAPDDKAHFLEGEQVMYSCPNNTMLVGDDTGTCTDHVFPPPPNCSFIAIPLAEGSGL